MPVRSFNSAVLKWPGRDAVVAAARRWATALRTRDDAIQRILCVGSYARGDWGVGSALDVIVVIRDTSLSAVERRARYEPTDVPVPCDLWVYIRTEREALARHRPILWHRLQIESLDLLQEQPRSNGV